MMPIHVDMDLIRALGPDGCKPEVSERLRRLADDLDRIAADDAPTARDLKAAPLLVDWQLALGWSGVCLAGFVAGHPLLANKRIATSPLWVLDPEFRWARTLSRFYRLGLPAGGGVPDGDSDADADRHGGKK